MINIIQSGCTEMIFYDQHLKKNENVHSSCIYNKYIPHICRSSHFKGNNSKKYLLNCDISCCQINIQIKYNNYPSESKWGVYTCNQL